MKKIYSLLQIMIITALSLFAQTPQKMSYQAVIRDSENQLIVNNEIGMRISILQGSVYGASVYVETQSPETNANGLVTIEIGSEDATVVTGNFSQIDWTDGPYFIKTETDPYGGTSYTISGTSQLLSVPYALHSRSSDVFIGEITESQISDLQNYLTEEADPVFEAWDKSTGISITESQISNLQNYLTTESDPAVSANFDFSGAATGDLLQFEGTKWVKVTPGYLTSYTETDPVFASSVSGGITATDTTNWHTAFGWGNHASAGYTPITRTLTINETSHDLSADWSWNVGTVTGIATVNGISGGTITTTGTIGLTGQALALHNLSTSGMIARTGAGTVAGRTIIAGTGITVTNGNGVSGNPAIAAKTYNIGDFAHGGIVFWVDTTGQHGLVCAKTDQSTGVRWYAGTYGNTQAKGDGPYAGKANTSIIIAAQVAIGDDNYTYAARICNELQITEGGKTYGDWYLPSKVELNLMWLNKSIIDATAIANGGSDFASANYWSSVEYVINHAWLQNFDSGNQYYSNKFNTTYRVRAVRAF